MQKVEAPWTKEQVDALNGYQNLGYTHEFTCSCKSRTTLVATTEGWTCPEDCGHEQKWAHAFMADKTLWPKNLFSKNNDGTVD